MTYMMRIGRFLPICQSFYFSCTNRMQQWLNRALVPANVGLVEYKYCVYSKATSICANRLHCNFHYFSKLYCTFFFADNKTESQSHKIEIIPFPFHSNDEYHQRNIQTYLLGDHHGADDDLFEEHQEGSGRSGGLVYAVLLHRSSFSWRRAVVQRFVTSKRRS